MKGLIMSQQQINSRITMAQQLVNSYKCLVRNETNESRKAVLLYDLQTAINKLANTLKLKGNLCTR